MATARGRKPKEVKIEWLKDILEGLGYKVELFGENRNTIIGEHDEMPTLILKLDKMTNEEGGRIVFQTFFKMKKPGLGKYSEMLKCLNRTNILSLFNTFVFIEEKESLAVISNIYLTESISETDIIIFLAMFNEGIAGIIEESGLVEFL